MRAPNVYLATADEDVSESHVKAVCQDYNIHLVVWDELKATKYPNENLVISYSVLANEIVPVFKQFWSMGQDQDASGQLSLAEVNVIHTKDLEVDQ